MVLGSSPRLCKDLASNPCSILGSNPKSLGSCDGAFEKRAEAEVAVDDGVEDLAPEDGTLMSGYPNSFGSKPSIFGSRPPKRSLGSIPAKDLGSRPANIFASSPESNFVSRPASFGSIEEKSFGSRAAISFDGSKEARALGS